MEGVVRVVADEIGEKREGVGRGGGGGGQKVGEEGEAVGGGKEVGLSPAEEEERGEGEGLTAEEDAGNIFGAEEREEVGFQKRFCFVAVLLLLESGGDAVDGDVEGVEGEREERRERGECGGGGGVSDW